MNFDSSRPSPDHAIKFYLLLSGEKVKYYSLKMSEVYANCIFFNQCIAFSTSHGFISVCIDVKGTFYVSIPLPIVDLYQTLASQHDLLEVLSS